MVTVPHPWIRNRSCGMADQTSGSSAGLFRKSFHTVRYTMTRTGLDDGTGGAHQDTPAVLHIGNYEVARGVSEVPAPGSAALVTGPAGTGRLSVELLDADHHDDPAGRAGYAGKESAGYDERARGGDQRRKGDEGMLWRCRAMTGRISPADGGPCCHPVSDLEPVVLLIVMVDEHVGADSRLSLAPGQVQ